MQAAIASKARRRERGQALVLVLIVLATVAALVWYLFHSRAETEQAAIAFAREAGTKLGRFHDAKFLDIHIGREVATQYPPSFRERLMNHLRRLGVASEQVDVEGSVSFESHFFAPRGRFQAHLVYPKNERADLHLAISSPHGRWQIDYINLVWFPHEQAPVDAGSTPPAPP